VKEAPHAGDGGRVALVSQTPTGMSISVPPFPARLRLAAFLGCALLVAGLLAGCYGLRPTPAPIPSEQLAAGSRGDECLVLLLPGRGDHPESYRRAGFAAIAAASGRVAADLVAVDAHMGYYRDRTVVERLRQDLVAPARAEGRRVWLVGISLGGLGALLYAAEHPEDVDGVVLLSPYLGSGDVLDEVEAAGSLAAWEPGDAEARGLWFRLWDELRALTAEGSDGPAIYLGFGDDDRLARSHRLLARELPPSHVLHLPGGHDWRTWKELWRRFTAAGVPACPP
jgi:pimeloyl-ACP methyl ester carboxylesterase